LCERIARDGRRDPIRGTLWKMWRYNRRSPAQRRRCGLDGGDAPRRHTLRKSALASVPAIAGDRCWLHRTGHVGRLPMSLATAKYGNDSATCREE
jgi:hypothetical protein